MCQPEIEEALLLLRKAQEDIDVVRKLVSDTDIADSVVGFHAQQAAEKALKAVLAASGDDFPWTHDLRHLMDRLERSKALFPAQKTLLTVVLRGVALHEVRWDPRFGPDRERSGVLGIGKQAVSRLAEGETLLIAPIDGGVRLD